MLNRGLQQIIDRLNANLSRDVIVQTTVNQLRQQLQVDRVVLYYFYKKWEGRVTFESLSSEKFSILGSTGPDECFNDEYAELYFKGRVRAIPDIEIEPIHPCHRDYLRNLHVRANLAVPVLSQGKLWGLLIAHHCQDAHTWPLSDIQEMQKAAQSLGTAPSIQQN
jgi:GAF domain-containing protein